MAQPQLKKTEIMANRIRPEKFKLLTDLSITDEDKIRLDQLLVLNGLVKVEDACKGFDPQGASDL